MAGYLSARGGFAGGSKLALTLSLVALMAWVMVRPSTALAQQVKRGTGVVRAAGTRTEREPDRCPFRYTKDRAFRIPFNIDQDGRSKIKEVQLWASEDAGQHWKPVSKTTPDRPSFTFRAARDGEYWFAVRIFGNDGQFYPSVNDPVEPSMKVMVDTKVPALILEPEPRRGTRASIHWQASDENLDLKTLAIEYQAEGVRDWRKVPIGKGLTSGSQQWNVGTADPVKVRASVSDKAGNVADARISLPQGAASLPESPGGEVGEPEAPPLSEITAGPGFEPVDNEPRREPARTRSGSVGRVKNSTSTRPMARANQASSAGDAEDFYDDSEPASPRGRAISAREQPVLPAGGSMFDTVQASPGLVAAGTPPPVAANPNPAGMFSAPAGVGAGAAAASTPPPDGSRPLLVAGPRFSLQYLVEDAGPNGPASVELWVTRDGGRSWTPRGADPDKTSPIEVDLGGEGTYGIRLVSRSVSGLGDQPPVPGDQPDRWIEVDASPPLVQLNPPLVGTGTHAGKLGISWRTTDAHPGSGSTRILWRPDQPGANWQPIVEGQENTGQFVWAIPAGIPPRIHLRIETIDALGHLGSAESTDSGAIIVDRSRPKSRIIGLDPNARSGMGSTGVQMR